MQHPARDITTYSGNQAYGESTNFYGNIYGNVNFPEKPREAGEPSLHQCLRDLRVTDPREDRARIEGDKDRLLRDCYAWILDDASFQRWRTKSESRLLWIKGDPGKGKTMMTMGLIDELSKKPGDMSRTISKTTAKLELGSGPCLLAYFFCQSGRPKLNNAVSVLRGLLYQLIGQRQDLIKHVQKRYTAVGKQLFEGPNAFYALREILSDMLNDASLPPTYFLIDAIDECTSGMSELLKVITDASLRRWPRVKWLVTSRNIPEVERYLQPDSLGVQLSLEVKASHVSRAVTAFVEYKVQWLAAIHKYDVRLQAEVQQQLRDKAEGTFLWVSLVCKELEGVPLYRTREVLQALPPGLNPLYDRMMAQIVAQDNVRTAQYCKDVLRAVTVAFRPLHVKELVIVAGLPSCQFDNPQTVADLVNYCGSFLTIRQDTVSFIHLSAKDYLTSGNGQHVFDSAVAEEQGQVTYRLLNAMRDTLQRDLCSLEKPGAQTKGMTERIQQSVLARIAYACEYWVDHLCDSNLTSLERNSNTLHDGGIVDVFLREKFLYWLEAISLCKSMLKGVISVAKLWSLIQGQGDASALTELIKDAHRFIMYHKGAIESSALQAYASALLFSPTKSLIRRLFQHEEPKWITISPAMSDNWSACLQTLEGHSDWVESVAFSHDSTWLASPSRDRTVKIWDANSGACLQTLEGHSDWVNSVAFSHDSTQLASASSDNTVKIWDASSSACLQTLRGHNDGVYSVAFSHDSTWLASASRDSTVKIWDASSGACLKTLKGHSAWVFSVAFSHNSTRLASASDDNTVKIWDASSGACLKTLEGHNDGVFSVAFSHDSTQLASASRDSTVKIWDASSGACLKTLKGHSRPVSSVAFSHDSTWLASASGDNTVKIWDASSGACLKTLEGHNDGVESVAFSHDSTQLASPSRDRTVKIWDASSGTCLQTLEGHSDWVNSVAFSHDSTRMASASNDSTLKIWDASSGACLKTLKGHNDGVYLVAFSHYSTRLASASNDNTVKIWNASSGACLQTLEGARSVAFSHDSTQLASVSDDNTVKIWDVSSRACLKTLKGHSDAVFSVAFSHNSTRLASASNDNTVKIWDASSGACLQTLKGHSDWVYRVAFSHDSTRLASSSWDSTVKIWDASSGACLQTLRGHNYGVYRVVFSNDSTRLASEWNDHTVKIWDASSGACLQTLKGHRISSLVGFETQQLIHRAIGVSSDETWITHNAQKRLWLPSEYRPCRSAVSDRCIGISTGSGKVWIYCLK